MTPEPRIIKVHIECRELPPPGWGGYGDTWIGIQEGKEVVQRVKLPADSVTFEAELRVGNDDSEASPNFLGPYAQGPKDGRFLYVCWGQLHLGRWVGFRRAKLPLTGLDWSAIKSNVVRGTLKCTDPKGGPICATVKPDHFSWSL
jgi:Family of unknown function (DUF5990)